MSFHEDSIWCECPACVSPRRLDGEHRMSMSEPCGCDCDADIEVGNLRAELADTRADWFDCDEKLQAAEAAIARVRECCDYLAGHIAEIILRALDGGTE